MKEDTAKRASVGQQQDGKWTHPVHPHVTGLSTPLKKEINSDSSECTSTALLLAHPSPQPSPARPVGRHSHWQLSLIKAVKNGPVTPAAPFLLRIPEAWLSTFSLVALYPIPQSFSPHNLLWFLLYPFSTCVLHVILFNVYLHLWSFRRKLRQSDYLETRFLWGGGKDLWVSWVQCQRTVRGERAVTHENVHVIWRKWTAGCVNESEWERYVGHRSINE